MHGSFEIFRQGHYYIPTYDLAYLVELSVKLRGFVSTRILQKES